ncbi:MAG: response regulator [Candidatus Omnitrophica bacterium]|nr:response regulator [Candidatus Omnitrophota bacterium]
MSHMKSNGNDSQETHTGHRILVVDDDRELLEATRSLLTQQGFQVTTCSESVKAPDLVKQHSFHAVLMDVRMPGLEGSDLLPIIKKVRPEVPVIIVSAHCDDSQVRYYHRLGAFEVISKPFTHEILLNCLNRAVDEKEEIPVVLTGLSLRQARDRVYTKLIVAALRKTDWNQVKAAELLGISRYCLMRWIKKLGISY